MWNGECTRCCSHTLQKRMAVRYMQLGMKMKRNGGTGDNVVTEAKFNLKFRNSAVQPGNSSLLFTCRIHVNFVKGILHLLLGATISLLIMESLLHIEGCHACPLHINIKTTPRFMTLTNFHEKK